MGKSPLRKTTHYEVHRLNKISSLASDLVDRRKGFDADLLDRRKGFDAELLDRRKGFDADLMDLRKGFDADLVERPTFGASQKSSTAFFYNTLSCGFRKSDTELK